MINIKWFKKDLRVEDHKPVYLASQSEFPCIPLYIFEPDNFSQKDAALRHWKFIKESLKELDKELQKRHAKLVFLIGDAVEIFKKIHTKYKVKTIFAHEETGNNWSYHRDKNVIAFCKAYKIKFDETPSNGVIRRLKSRDEWSKIQRLRISQAMCLSPNHIPFFSKIKGHNISEVGNSYFRHDSYQILQQGGAPRGIALLDSFISHRAKHYNRTLSSPVESDQFSSRLSPYLAFGNLSIKQVFHRINAREPSDQYYLNRGISSMKSRLYWHCHFIQKLEDQPEIESKCIHPYYEDLRDQNNITHLQAWINGETGYPMVDAVMRCLNQTGWINFRMRAMVTSFASYDLWLDWRQFGPKLACLFTDYEPGIHYPQLQMQSGVTGINTVRIYNPIKQSQDQDPEGSFIKRYLPELYHVPREYIHEPWLMSYKDQIKYKCVLNTDYPKPITDHIQAYKEAKTKISKIMRLEGYRKICDQIYEKLGSRKKQHNFKTQKRPKKINTLKNIQQSFDF